MANLSCHCQGSYHVTTPGLISPGRASAFMWRATGEASAMETMRGLSFRSSFSDVNDAYAASGRGVYTSTFCDCQVPLPLSLSLWACCSNRYDSRCQLNHFQTTPREQEKTTGASTLNLDPHSF